MIPIAHIPWQEGPAAGHEGPVFVSFTLFTADHRRDLPGIYRTGLRLRRSWPQIDGAVGMWLWGEVGGRSGGSVSAWREEAAMMGFVRWAPHVEVMRHYRERGSLVARRWESERLERRSLWEEARRLAGELREATSRGTDGTELPS